MGQTIQRWLTLLCLLTASQVFAQPTLVIIIDDVGNNGPLGERAVNLPGPVTLAFLPHTPHAARLARKAADSNKGIMLHAPMANATGAALGPGALTEDMSPEELQQTIHDSINAIPFVQGVNNHMGSRLTANQTAMSAIMPVIQQHHLYFIDSLTNPASVAQSEARSLGIATDRRDVFLDNDRSLEGLFQQFERAINIAERTGSVILIGHPYPETLDFLETVLPPLIANDNVRLIPADEHLKNNAWLTKENATPYPVSRLQMQLILPSSDLKKAKH
ncbi:MAG: divergent polysaccharide deacetylase family protein [Pseudomonadota bacterium]|nr:divergent polysaccharide deacetylase family protein [Pseudomonadota bacterium]